VPPIPSITRLKRAGFRDVGNTLDTFDFDFNRKLDRRLVFDLAAGHFISKHEDALFLGPPGTGKSHLAQGIGHAAIQQGHKVLYREAHVLLEELAESTLDGRRKEHFTELATVPLLIIDDLGMRRLPARAAEDLSSWPCAATSGPPPSSPRTGPSRTGERRSATWLR
jgi:DNA replication protein DnaC